MTEARKLTGKTAMPAAWEPAAVTPADITAIKALIVGKATDTQQLMFVSWLERATGVTELEFRPGERESAFAGGKRFVGMQFFTLAKTFVPNDPKTR